MKKSVVQKMLAVMVIFLLMSITVFGGTQKDAGGENADAAGTESIAEIKEADTDARMDPTDLPEENAGFKLASEESEVLPGSTGETAASAAASETASTAAEAAAETGLMAADPSGENPEEPAESGQDKKDIMILYTSDIHCGVFKGFGLGGLQQIRDELEKQGYEVLLVDDGDAVQGELIGTVTKGEEIIKLMNDMHYDVAIPGNHEFDFGMEQFDKFVEMAEFPYISCNFTREGSLVFKPYIIKEVNGIKIAFVGVTTPETLSSTRPTIFLDEDGNRIYGFMEDETGEKLWKAVQDSVDSAREEGADLVYVIAHLGNNEENRPWTYADVIANTTGIDVMLDGHSHDTDQVVMKNKEGKDVVRSAVGTKLNCVGYSHISAEGKILDTNIWTWFNNQSAPELFGIKNEIEEKVDASVEEAQKSVNIPVGESKVDLKIYDPKEKNSNGQPVRIVRRMETNLGDFCADAIRAGANTDIAVLNSGGIRDNIDKGEVTLNDLLTIFPFNNSICTIEATGQQILDALEWGSHATPKEFAGLLQVSGLTYEIHSYIKSTCTSDESSMFTGVTGERRVKNVMVGDEPLDPEKTYTVSGISYVLTDKGDGHTSFEGAPVISNEVGQDVDILMQYIKEDLGGTIGDKYADPYGDGRIVIIDEAPEGAAQ